MSKIAKSGGSVGNSANSAVDGVCARIVNGRAAGPAGAAAAMGAMGSVGAVAGLAALGAVLALGGCNIDMSSTTAAAVASGAPGLPESGATVQIWLSGESEDRSVETQTASWTHPAQDGGQNAGVFMRWGVHTRNDTPLTVSGHFVERSGDWIVLSRLRDAGTSGRIYVHLDDVVAMQFD